jgi:anti-sigma-K factor RskA
MASDHEHWEEQSELFALGALDERESREFAGHLAACALCAARLREARETLTLLPGSLEPLTPAAAIKDRLLRRLDRDNVVPLASAQPRTSTRWGNFCGAIAAGIIGLVIGGAYYRFQYEPRHSLYTSVINLLRDPATRDYSLYGAGPAPQAKGRFLWNQSGEGHIFVSNLPAAPAGKMYAVWTIARSSAPRYVGTITTDATGQGGLHINTPSSELPVETFAVTLEPAGSTAKPMGPMVLVSKPS